MKLLLALLSLVIAVASHAAAALPGKKVSLAKPDMNALAKVACAAPGSGRAQSFEAWKYRSGAPALVVHVVCEPNQQMEGLPVVHRATCGNERGNWECDAGYNAVVVRPDLALVLRAVPLRKALNILPELAKNADSYGRPAADYLSGVCTVTASMPFKGAEKIRFECGAPGGRVAITKDCRTPGCRFYVSEALW